MRFEPLPDAEPQQQRRDHGNADRVADQKRRPTCRTSSMLNWPTASRNALSSNRVERGPGQPSREQHRGHRVDG